jgi:hypothetical protein
MRKLSIERVMTERTVEANTWEQIKRAGPECEHMPPPDRRPH